MANYKVNCSCQQYCQLSTILSVFVIWHFTYLGVRMHPTQPPAYGRGPSTSNVLRARPAMASAARVFIVSSSLPGHRYRLTDASDRVLHLPIRRFEPKRRRLGWQDRCVLSSSVLFQALGPYTHKTHNTLSKRTWNTWTTQIKDKIQRYKKIVPLKVADIKYN